MDVNAKLEDEKKTVSLMIALYCKRHHHSPPLCPQCAELDTYARSRSDKCPFMETKTFCVNCSVHCYAPEMRERICTVMRYAGPRMVFHHPVMALRHLVASRRERKRLQTSPRQER